jgi:hypothetical protein
MKAPARSPDEVQAYRMRAYSNIDRILSRKEIQKKEFRCKEIREYVLSIGARPSSK